MLYQLSYVRAWLNDTEVVFGYSRGSNKGVTADHSVSWRAAAAAAIAQSPDSFSGSLSASSGRS
jgi:hypothetical protein